MEKLDFVQTIYDIDNAISSMSEIIENSEVGNMVFDSVVENFISLCNLRQSVIKDSLLQNCPEFFEMAINKHVRCSICNDRISFSVVIGDDIVYYNMKM